MWVSLPLRQAAAQQGVSPERLSRLASRAIEPFSAALEALSRRGRPPADRHRSALQVEVAILRALLDAARSLLAFVPRRRADVRALFVGAWLRLQQAHPTLTQARFCQELSLSTRTLRHWLCTDPPAPTTPTPLPAPSPPRRRPPRRPRFGFDMVLPDTQHAADTTDLRAFGVPLKLMALQDVGGRDQDLFDSVIVDTTESADHVVALVAEACEQLPGAQLLTDQGTPYMAKRTLEQLDALDLEHAPNVEADPRGKATVERAFGTLKSIAAPLLAISDRIATRLPQLASPELAQAAATVLIAALLRAYQAGARAARTAALARGHIDADELAERAHAQREQVRADRRSSRLILARIHEAYDLPGASRPFVDAFRRYAPDVLLDAERRLATQVHRDDIRDRKSYFAAIVRNVADEHRRDRRRQQLDDEREQRRAADQRAYDAQLAHHRACPLDWLRDALDAIALQWVPASRALLAGGVGLGTAWLARATARLVELNGPAAADLVHASVRDWSRHHLDHLGAHGVRAVLDVARPYLDHIPTANDEVVCPNDFASAILRSTGPPPRPAPLTSLRT